MKTFISLFALFLSLSLTAQTNTATWYLNDTSGNGIQTSSNTASGSVSVAMGVGTTASGQYSTSMGVETTASGGRSTAMGHQTEASGEFSTAMGRETTASGDYSTAMGDYTIASGALSTAMGFETTASGSYSTTMCDRTIAYGYASTAMGNQTQAGGNFSTALGRYTLANGPYSTAMGYDTRANGNTSIAMGTGTRASGQHSIVMGIYTIAKDYNSLVLGQCNLAGSTITSSGSEFNLDNTAFVIGNGTDSDSRSDALTVLFDGTTTIAGDLNVNSDARLKANIVSLGSTLSKLLQIDGKSYTMKKDESEKQKIGLLAQDIEKVFPELVSESNGIKSVNYQGLVPVLINALKEQDAMMKEQESKYLKQEKRLERLERLVAAMD